LAGISTESRPVLVDSRLGLRVYPRGSPNWDWKSCVACKSRSNSFIESRRFWLVSLDSLELPRTWDEPREPAREPAAARSTTKLPRSESRPPPPVPARVVRVRDEPRDRATEDPREDPEAAKPKGPSAWFVAARRCAKSVSTGGRFPALPRESSKESPPGCRQSSPWSSPRASAAMAVASAFLRVSASASAWA